MSADPLHETGCALCGGTDAAVPRILGLSERICIDCVSGHQRDWPAIRRELDRRRAIESPAFKVGDRVRHVESPSIVGVVTEVDTEFSHGTLFTIRTNDGVNYGYFAKSLRALPANPTPERATLSVGTRFNWSGDECDVYEVTEEFVAVGDDWHGRAAWQSRSEGAVLQNQRAWERRRVHVIATPVRAPESAPPLAAARCGDVHRFTHDACQRETGHEGYHSSKGYQWGADRAFDPAKWRCRECGEHRDAAGSIAEDESGFVCGACATRATQPSPPEPSIWGIPAVRVTAPPGPVCAKCGHHRPMGRLGNGDWICNDCHRPLQVVDPGPLDARISAARESGGEGGKSSSHPLSFPEGAHEDADELYCMS